MSLSECMQKVSHREFLFWQDYFSEEMNEPTVTHQYLMQIAAEIRRVLSKKPNTIKQEWFKLSFKKDKGKAKPKEVSKAHKKAKSNISKSRWASIVGLNKKKKDKN